MTTDLDLTIHEPITIPVRLHHTLMTGEVGAPLRPGLIPQITAETGVHFTATDEAGVWIATAPRERWDDLGGPETPDAYLPAADSGRIVAVRLLGCQLAGAAT